MPNPVSFRYLKTSPEIIQIAVMLYVRFPLSLRNLEDLLNERGLDVSYESVGYWWHRFGSQFARQIKKRRVGGMHSSNWRWRNVQTRDVLACLSDSTVRAGSPTTKLNLCAYVLDAFTGFFAPRISRSTGHCLQVGFVFGGTSTFTPSK